MSYHKLTYHGHVRLLTANLRTYIYLEAISNGMLSNGMLSMLSNGMLSMLSNGMLDPS
jgi:hypothetical protein